MFVMYFFLGNNLFLYFVKWLDSSMGQERSHEWINKHIKAYFAVGKLTLASILSSEQVLLYQEVQRQSGLQSVELLQVQYCNNINISILPLFICSTSLSGIPIARESARRMGSTWGSASWLLPFSDPNQPIKWHIPLASVKFKGKSELQTFYAHLNNFTNGDFFKELAQYDSTFEVNTAPNSHLFRHIYF